jgi:hypothetical protein
MNEIGIITEDLKLKMNNLIPHITQAEARPGYKLFIEFEDGVKGIVDLSKWKGVFNFWNEEENFKSFIITKDKKLQWNEHIDMDPDSFYLQLIGKNFEEYASDKQFLWNSH